MLQLNHVQNGRLKIKGIRKATGADRRLAASACGNFSADVKKPPC
jgi:hypothetical protein